MTQFTFYRNFSSGKLVTVKPNRTFTREILFLTFLRLGSVNGSRGISPLFEMRATWQLMREE